MWEENTLRENKFNIEWQEKPKVHAYFHLSLLTQNLVEIKEKKCLVEQTLACSFVGFFVLPKYEAFWQTFFFPSITFSLSERPTICLPFLCWNTFDEALVNEKKDKPNVKIRKNFYKNSKYIQVTWKAVWTFTFTLTQVMMVPWHCSQLTFFLLYGSDTTIQKTSARIKGVVFFSKTEGFF